MSEKFEKLAPKQIEFINNQSIFFVGTAGAEGLVNVSPKGMDSFRVIDDSKVVWLNMTGSGNESAAHVLENGRMTVMFCSFEKHPLILRLYGKARVVHRRDNDWAHLSQLFCDIDGARQFFELDIEMVQISCGFGVPLYEYQGERETLNKWAKKKGPEGVEDYWKKNNIQSLDGKKTGIFAE